MSAIDALAGYGLPGASPPPAEGWGPDLDEVAREGLAGLLAAAHDAGHVELAGTERALLSARIAEEAQLAVRLEAELLRLRPVLDRHGGVVLKGPALVHGLGLDPATRPFSDLDVLVAPRSIERVLRDLARLGYQRPRPDPSPRFASLVAKATAVAHPTGLLVDLHRTLTLGAAGERIDVDEVLAGRVEVVAGDVVVPAPSWPTHLVVVALHAALGDGLRRARSIRDVALVAHHDELDAAAALALARRWDVLEPVGAALAAARARLGVDLPDALVPLADASATWAAPRLPRVDQLGPGAGLRARRELARSMVAPTPAYLRWAYGPRPLPALYWRRWRDLGGRATGAGEAA
ncbi:MAG: nucleotidyltransferase family protein [Acidimicrobiales bacterium]